MCSFFQMLLKVYTRRKVLEQAFNRIERPESCGHLASQARGEQQIIVVIRLRFH